MSVGKYVLALYGLGPRLWGNLYAESLHGDHAVPDREAHERGQVLHAELEHDATAVGVDACRGDIEHCGDLLARAARDDHFEHLPLPAAEPGPRRACAFRDGIDIDEDVARAVCGIEPQRRALARPDGTA